MTPFLIKWSGNLTDYTPQSTKEKPMPLLTFEIDEVLLRTIVKNYIQSKLGDIVVKDNEVKIEVKSQQNYRAEWENASFRARYSTIVKD